jgi:uncharacterized membrane protein YfcA
LLAIVPVAIAGTIRNDSYGNVRRHDALLMGLLSLAGAAAGVALANQLTGRLLRDAFAALMVLVAVQLVRRALSEGPAAEPREGDAKASAPSSAGGDPAKPWPSPPE